MECGCSENPKHEKQSQPMGDGLRRLEEARKELITTRECVERLKSIRNEAIQRRVQCESLLRRSEYSKQLLEERLEDAHAENAQLRHKIQLVESKVRVQEIQMTGMSHNAMLAEKKAITLERSVTESRQELKRIKAEKEMLMVELGATKIELDMAMKDIEQLLIGVLDSNEGAPQVTVNQWMTGQESHVVSTELRKEEERCEGNKQRIQNEPGSISMTDGMDEAAQDTRRAKQNVQELGVVNAQHCEKCGAVRSSTMEQDEGSVPPPIEEDVLKSDWETANMLYCLVKHKAGESQEAEMHLEKLETPITTLKVGRHVTESNPPHSPLGAAPDDDELSCESLADLKRSDRGLKLDISALTSRAPQEEELPEDAEEPHQEKSVVDAAEIVSITLEEYEPSGKNTLPIEESRALGGDTGGEGSFYEKRDIDDPDLKEKSEKGKHVGGGLSKGVGLGIIACGVIAIVGFLAGRKRRKL